MEDKPKNKGGRPKGALNKRTLARLAHEARMEETEGGVSIGRMTEPEVLVYKMRWWLNRFAKAQQEVPQNTALMEKCLDKAHEAAVAAAPYHHARLSALMVGSAVVTKIEVTGGMPDEFAAPAVEGPILPGTIVTADDDVVDVPEPPKAAAG